MRPRKAASGPAGSSCSASGELAAAWMAAAESLVKVRGAFAVIRLLRRMGGLRDVGRCLWAAVHVLKLTDGAARVAQMLILPEEKRRDRCLQIIGEIAAECANEDL